MYKHIISGLSLVTRRKTKPCANSGPYSNQSSDFCSFLNKILKKRILERVLEIIGVIMKIMLFGVRKCQVIITSIVYGMVLLIQAINSVKK